MTSTLESYPHGHEQVFAISWPLMWTIDRLNELYRKNLLRLLKQTGLKKGEFAAKAGFGGDYLSQLIRDKYPVPIGKDTLLKICNAFHVSPRYFDYEEDEPIPLTIHEEKAVYRTREAENLGPAVVEQLELITDAVIEASKKRGKTAESTKKQPGGYLDKIETLKQERAKGKKKKTG